MSSGSPRCRAGARADLAFRDTPAAKPGSPPRPHLLFFPAMFRPISTVAAVCDRRLAETAVTDRRYRKAVGMLALFATLAAAAAGAGSVPEIQPAAGVPGRECGLPLFRNFPPTAYRGSNQVWAGAAGPDGTMFFGNNGQVLEFDGLTWRGIEVPGGSHLRGLAVDGDGVPWVAGVDELGRLEPGPDGRRRFVSLRAQVPKEAGDLGTFWQVHATDQGVWFQANGTTLRWRDGKFDHWPTGDKSIVLSFWLGDHLLVATTKGWFRPGDGGRWEALGQPAAKLGDYLPHFAVPHPRGGWLLGLEGPNGDVAGLARWDGAKLAFEPHVLDEYFKAKRLYGARRLADGRYLFMTLQGGAVLLDAELNFLALLDEKTGLESNAVISATPDAHHGLWLGTEWGVSRVQVHPAYSWFGPANGLSKRGVEAFIRWQGHVLVNGSAGLMRLEVPRGVGCPKFERWTTMDEKIWVFAPSRGRLLAGGLGGLWQIEPDGAARKLRSFSNIFGIVESRVTPDRLYTPSLNGLGVWRWQGAEWGFDQALTETLRTVRGNSAAEAADGSVWVGTDNQGVWRVRFPAGGKPEAVKLGTDAGLTEEMVRARISVVEIGGQPLFLTRRGLLRFDGAAGRFRPEPAYGARFADGSTRVSAITPDGHGGLWLLVQDATTNLTVVAPQLLHLQDGRATPLPLPEPERVSGKTSLQVETIDGRDLLWVVGQSSVLRVDLTVWRAQAPTAPGATILSEVVAGSKRRLDPRAAAGPQLGARENSVRFAFGTPGLAGEPEVRHETQLVGFADGGPLTEAAGERTFTNLPPGRYTFAVRGTSVDGRWSEPARFTFVVLAPWWQTPAAVAGWVALFGLLLFTYIRWRIRGLRRERNRLERVVADRTAELAEKNRELERLHRVDQDEKLAARLAEEKAQLELLRYQLNPHFLYNSLNSIRALVFTNAAAAGEMVTRLSEFCRWTLTHRSEGLTTVGEEADMLQAYLDIERTRWQDGLKANIEVDPAVRQDPLPQFLFLPLLENAIKYGGRTSPNVLEVTAHVKLEDDQLVCEVANTGKWIEPGTRAPMGAESTGIGLENLRQRLARHYGPDCRPEILTMPGWVCVRLRLPRHPKPPGSHSPV